MRDKAKKYQGKSYDYGKDFQILTIAERRVVLENAKNLLKLQRENAVLLADAPNPATDSGKWLA
jgi:hypothetical protein